MFTIIYIAANVIRAFTFDATPHGIASAFVVGWAQREPADSKEDLIKTLEATGRTYVPMTAEQFHRASHEARQQRNYADLMPRCPGRPWSPVR